MHDPEAAVQIYAPFEHAISSKMDILELYSGKLKINFFISKMYKGLIKCNNND